MLHPSYTELIKVVNSEVEDGDTPVVNSRYSIVLATAKRARQIIDGKEPMSMPKIHKPLSIAVDEMNKGLLKIMPESAVEETELEENVLTEAGLLEDFKYAGNLFDVIDVTKDPDWAAYDAQVEAQNKAYVQAREDLGVKWDDSLVG